jgi:hypothetical protein
VELRVNIYSKIWSACSEEARAEVRKDLLFNATHEEGNDPLKLWEMLVRHCSVVSKSGDSRGARMAAEKSFGTLRQDASTSLSTFLKEFNARVSIMTIQGCLMPEEDMLACQFIDKLDAGRYWQLKDFVKSLPQKTTVASAYEQACDWTVRKSQAMPRRETAALASNTKIASKTMQGSKCKSEEKGEESADEVECWECFKKGHISRDCKAGKRTEVMSAPRQPWSKKQKV